MIWVDAGHTTLHFGQQVLLSGHHAPVATTAAHYQRNNRRRQSSPKPVLKYWMELNMRSQIAIAS
jgi:hypothetical protein